MTGPQSDTKDPAPTAKWPRITDRFRGKAGGKGGGEGRAVPWNVSQPVPGVEAPQH